ncbi:MAG: FHA domain-containing protein [Planctomycetota bacterium]
MRLVVKKDGQTVNELRYERGPIHIGRHEHSQVFLPDRAVSRQHAAIFVGQDGKWVVEDLDSANKTYLNDEVIHKAQIKTGDCVRIADFTIEIHLENEAGAGRDIHLEDTLISSPRKSGTVSTGSAREIIVRRPDAEHAPEIRLPAKRVNDFLQATEAICKANGPDAVVKTLLAIALRQFSAYHSWCALRALPEGPMTTHAGKSRDGHAVELSQIKIAEKITEAIEKKEFLLVPRVSSPTDEEKIRSAMIAPVLDPSGCFGVLYVDNKMDHQHYTLGDLDYLMLLAIHTAAVVENF